MRLVDYINPTTPLNTCENFKKLACAHKTLTIVVSVVAGIALVGYGGFVAFRALTNKFSQVNLEGKDPLLSEQAIRVQALATTPSLPLSPIQSKPKPPANIVPWKGFMRTELQKQLAEMGLKFEEAEDDGDCFFTTVAHLMSLLKRQNYTKQNIRNACKDFLKDYEGNTYKKLLEQDVEGFSYEKFCNNIGLCKEDFTKNGAPIWGNNATTQLIADIFQVKVEIHSITMYEVDLHDLSNGTLAFQKYYQSALFWVTYY